MKLRSYILYGTIILLFVLIANLPASLVLRQVPGGDDFANNSNGTIWIGSAATPAVSVSWEADLHKLVMFAYSLSISATGDNIHMSGIVDLAPYYRSVENLAGSVDGTLISSFLKEANVSFSKPVNFNAVSLTLSGGKYSDASGEMSFPGDVVNFSGPDGIVRIATLPPLKGLVKQDGDNADITISDANSNELMIKIVLSGDGWANIELTTAFLHLFQGYDKSDISLIIKHKLF